MNRIKEQIESYMKPAVGDNGSRSATFTFPPEFIGFQGHFPGQSILPGACQLQCLLSQLEQLSGKALALKEIVLAKYISPILPGQEIRCLLTETPNLSSEEFAVRALIFRGVDKVTELRVRVASPEVV